MENTTMPIRPSGNLFDGYVQWMVYKKNPQHMHMIYINLSKYATSKNIDNRALLECAILNS